MGSGLGSGLGSSKTLSANWAILSDMSEGTTLITVVMRWGAIGSECLMSRPRVIAKGGLKWGTGSRVSSRTGVRCVERGPEW